MREFMRLFIIIAILCNVCFAKNESAALESNKSSAKESKLHSELFFVRAGIGGFSTHGLSLLDSTIQDSLAGSFNFGIGFNEQIMPFEQILFGFKVLAGYELGLQILDPGSKLFNNIYMQTQIYGGYGRVLLYYSFTLESINYSLHYKTKTFFGYGHGGGITLILDPNSALDISVRTSIILRSITAYFSYEYRF